MQQEIDKEDNDTKTPIPQLLMFMSGVGGTGKSYVIKAIQEWFAARDKSHWLQTAAPTGTAASDIGGSTLHSLLGIKPRRGMDDEAEMSTSTRGKISESMRGKKLLIIDEISMVNCKLAAEASSALNQAMNPEENVNWGGLHVLFVGDHSQLPPVGNKPLYAKSAMKAPPDSTRTAVTKTIQGRPSSTWINKCVNRMPVI
jgi:ATP-dependent exoDNAse (exonuclease V) alpha subunit